MAIFGWQHLDTPVNYIDVREIQLEQAAIVKTAHPNLPTMIYAGFGFAFGINAAIDKIMNDPQFSNYFLMYNNVSKVHTNTDCQQAHTSPSATGGRCTGYFWNMANASARDYYIENIVAPLAANTVIDGVFFDAFNYGYDIPEVTPWGEEAVNVPNCHKKGVQGAADWSGCDALLKGTIDVAIRAGKLLNDHSKVPMYANVGTFQQPYVGQNIWLNESHLADALDEANVTWLSYYESARAEAMLQGCPERNGTAGWCLIHNMLEESKRGIAGAVHTYLKNETEAQNGHIAAFMLARSDYWYYFGVSSTAPSSLLTHVYAVPQLTSSTGLFSHRAFLFSSTPHLQSTGWWDDSYKWDPLYDSVSKCGKPKGAAQQSTNNIFTRSFTGCDVTLDCSQVDFCRGEIKMS